jgi:hypothetical protein
MTSHGPGDHDTPSRLGAPFEGLDPRLRGVPLPPLVFVSSISLLLGLRLPIIWKKIVGSWSYEMIN